MSPNRNHAADQQVDEPARLVVDPKNSYLSVSIIVLIVGAAIGATSQISEMRSQITQVAQVQREMKDSLREFQSTLAAMVTARAALEQRITRTEDRLTALYETVQATVRNATDYITRQEYEMWHRRLKELNDTIRMPEEGRRR